MPMTDHVFLLLFFKMLIFLIIQEFKLYTIGTYLWLVKGHSTILKDLAN